MEDAALLRPESGPALVLTVDFITPIVDEPETFGAIAAANALSDVYSMGAEPKVALAVCGFPDEQISNDILERIFRGARDKAAEAGCAIVGGHTIIDPELKYGLCVLGTVEAERALRQTRAEVGDRLVLTKPLGLGLAAQAIKQQRLPAEELDAAVEAMLTLNAGARDAAQAAGAHAATDVTGFGLLGHLHNLLLASGRSARLDIETIPFLPFARRLAEEGLVPGGSKRNRDYVEPHVHWHESVDPLARLLICDAQTSGGLLIAVPREGEATLLAELGRRQQLAYGAIGEISEGEPGRIEVASGSSGRGSPVSGARP